MHAYDPSSRAQYTHPIPGMRPSHEQGTTQTADRGSTTPIYDALYAEYRRSFRALPGDRTDEPETSEVLRGSGNWGRTAASTGHWEVVGRQPYHPRAHAPAALPPGQRDARPHGR
ncbi:hypothetical protein DY245_39095 [Streptomyces inhibens]|uniref:Uncharacterized protein n=1 Tax=Streptomyces inhibens TaxID=2293571 RepID=A0A371PRT2_STRIH|nr:hypothetical protein [Streptomyces inhibens]REK85208.1 hypothetical protein DY245_39095 [Streptomyces inhibens]